MGEAERAAAEDGVTLRELVEEGLRRVLEARLGRAASRLRRVTFGGRGLQASAAVGTWERIRDLAYEGRGS